MEENNRLDRYEALQIEAVTSGRKNAAIEMKWADLLNMDIPQELNDQLQFQKSACRQIIDSKDRRIEDFKTELKNKDEEYIKMLKQQRLDITTLISKMRDQYHSLRQHYEEQLGDIEQAFEEERKEMLQKNKAFSTVFNCFRLFPPDFLWVSVTFNFYRCQMCYEQTPGRDRGAFRTAAAYGAAGVLGAQTGR